VLGPAPDDCHGTTPTEVAMKALGIGVDSDGNADFAKLGRAQQNQIMSAMARLGWERGKRTKTDRLWVPTDKWFRRCKAAGGAPGKAGLPAAAETLKEDDSDGGAVPF
jgi:hypothetical protein